jgi:hypothetical protein
MLGIMAIAGRRFGLDLMRDQLEREMRDVSSFGRAEIEIAMEFAQAGSEG